MTISAHFRFVDQIPVSVATMIQDVARVDGLNRVTVYDLMTSDWKRTIACIRKGGVKLLRTTPAISEQSVYDWESPPSDWVGAIVSADYVAALANPTQDFVQDFGAPCGGIVKAELPIVVHEAPSGHVACIGDEVVVSSAFLGLVDDELLECRGSVLNRGGKVLGWHRIGVTNKCNVLADESVRPGISCALCQADLVPRSGIWIAVNHARINRDLAQDVIGYSHLGLRFPILLSPDWAKKCARFCQVGLALEPIYAHDSPTAALARSFFSEIDDVFERVNSGRSPSI